MDGEDSLAIGRQCPLCNANVAWEDTGPCGDHQLLREAKQQLVVVFVAP